MDEALKSYLDEMKREPRTDILNAESRLVAKLDRAAESYAVDVGHLHCEIRAALDRLKKIDSNVTTGVEMLVRQSRWHDETDTKVLENRA